MVSNIHFNNNTNMLAAFRERKVVVWSLPSVVFTDRELLAKTTIELETEDMGKSAFIIGYGLGPCAFHRCSASSGTEWR